MGMLSLEAFQATLNNPELGLMNRTDTCPLVGRRSCVSRANGHATKHPTEHLAHRPDERLVLELTHLHEGRAYNWKPTTPTAPQLAK